MTIHRAQKAQAHGVTTATIGLAIASTLFFSGCAADAAPAVEATDAAAAALLPDDIRDGGVLTVGTFAPSPPTRMYEEDGTTLTGLDIAIVESIGKSLGLTVEFSNMKWDGLLPALRSERFNVVAAQVGDFEERRMNGDFVDYFTTGAAAMGLAAADGDYSDVLDLCGKRVGFQTGVAAATALPLLSERCLTERPDAGAMALSPFPADAAGLLALRSGQLDIHVMDGTGATYQASLDQPGEPLAVVIDAVVERANIGLVINKKKPELRDAIATALETMLTNGEYETILKEYAMEQYGVKAITINQTETATGE
ncbi:transporter substrate-binding domain-containing protein [Cryobacterium sp. PH31-O1]|uniref:transporter substrate-binding domain-containing protein n=1 Tax=Cryobacterium sp. PH31-O1 TaxID=3046306 RepID=UPI0024BACAB8|nr:transporter substrate-binding domain-containing protein [Cryobacterium sp. PH31-O1]MDJ0339002.1 transporter substrate-binding domain-containing protein [Cryobacterium sp. PH31-O1]